MKHDYTVTFKANITIDVSGHDDSDALQEAQDTLDEALEESGAKLVGGLLDITIEPNENEDEDVD
jgi:hypothetical protein